MVDGRYRWTDRLGRERADETRFLQAASAAKASREFQNKSLPRRALMTLARGAERLRNSGVYRKIGDRAGNTPAAMSLGDMRMKPDCRPILLHDGVAGCNWNSP